MKKLYILILLISVFFTNLVFSTEYGLVLSGGGGKGAYEVGVWQALEEYGLTKKITCISGTSVGGLNSALFSCESTERINSIWKNQVPIYLTEGDALISQPGLRKIIDTIPLSKLQTNKYPRVTITTVQNKNLITKALLSIKKEPGSYACRFCLNDEKSLLEIKNLLMATSAFPGVCKPIKLKDGFEYCDGGFEQAGGDNTPLEPIVTNKSSDFNIQKIFIIYLSNNPTRVFRDIDYDKYELIKVIPSIDLGGLLDGTTNFTASRVELLIKTGYNDTVKVLRSKGYYPVSSFWFD